MTGDGGRTAAHDMFDADVASKGLGIELVSAGDGAAVARMRVTPSMLNGHAIGHGGFVFLLALGVQQPRPGHGGGRRRDQLPAPGTRGRPAGGVRRGCPPQARGRRT